MFIPPIYIMLLLVADRSVGANRSFGKLNAIVGARAFITVKEDANKSSTAVAAHDVVIAIIIKGMAKCYKKREQNNETHVRPE